MEADPQNNTDRMQHLSEEPATGALKASLLRVLAEEALAKGNPVLVIPLESATEPAGDSDEGSTCEEPHHEMRLPKNTTVIFTSESGFPVIAAPAGAKVAQTSGSSTTGSSTTGSSTSGSGSAANAAARRYSEGTRKAEKKRLSYDEVKHLQRPSPQPQSEDVERR